MNELIAGFVRDSFCTAAPYLAKELGVDSSAVYTAINGFLRSEAVGKKPHATTTTVDMSDGVIRLVKDYTAKGVALFGDTKPHREALKVIGLKFNGKLPFGPGWIGQTSKLAAIQVGLQEAGIKFVMVTRASLEAPPANDEKSEAGSEKSEAGSEEDSLPSSRMLGSKKKTQAKAPTISELKAELKTLGLPTTGAKNDLMARLADHKKQEDEPARPPAKTAPPSKGKAAPAKKAPPPAKKASAAVKEKSTLKKNRWGNYADKKGFVYQEMPQPSGKKRWTVIGTQDEEGDETGIDSVLPLDDEDMDALKKLRIPFDDSVIEVEDSDEEDESDEEDDEEESEDDESDEEEEESE